MVNVIPEGGDENKYALHNAPLEKSVDVLNSSSLVCSAVVAPANNVGGSSAAVTTTADAAIHLNACSLLDDKLTVQRVMLPAPHPGDSLLISNSIS
jgi:hypothetical protein